MKNPKENKIAKRIAFRIIAIVVLFFAAAVLNGCKSQQSVTEHVVEHTNTNDSALADVHYVHDTIIQHDTIFIQSKQINESETQSGTTIEFSECGGTYNAKTGEASNVKSATSYETKKVRELTEKVEQLTTENIQLHTSLDSLKARVIVNASDKESETYTKPVEMTKWQRFFHTSGIIAWCVLAILAIIGIVKLLRKFKVIPV